MTRKQVWKNSWLISSYIYIYFRTITTRVEQLQLALSLPSVHEYSSQGWQHVRWHSAVLCPALCSLSLSHGKGLVAHSAQQVSCPTPRRPLGAKKQTKTQYTYETVHLRKRESKGKFWLWVANVLYIFWALTSRQCRRRVREEKWYAMRNEKKEWESRGLEVGFGGSHATLWESNLQGSLGCTFEPLAAGLEAAGCLRTDICQVNSVRTPCAKSKGEETLSDSFPWLHVTVSQFVFFPQATLRAPPFEKSGKEVAMQSKEWGENIRIYKSLWPETSFTVRWKSNQENVKEENFPHVKKLKILDGWGLFVSLDHYLNINGWPTSVWLTSTTHKCQDRMTH